MTSSSKSITAFIALIFIFQTSSMAKESGLSLKTDPGFVTLKDVTWTLPDSWGNVSFFGRERLRYEAWDYFSSANDNDYQFLASQLRLGARWNHDIFAVNYTHQYTQLSNLPTKTSAGAGSGSLYFSNSSDRNSYDVFVKYLNLEIKQTRKLLKPLLGDLKWLRGVTETFGRFNYSSGNEMKSADKKIEWLKNMRIADRVIGGFEWSHYGRSFDGVKVAREDDWSNINFAAFSPTQGGFEEHAHRSINDVDVIAVEGNIKKDPFIPGMEEQLFYYGYNDHRDIIATTTRLDNTGRSIPAHTESQVSLHTFGGHLVGRYDVGPGTWDVLGWGALQRGDWFELDHSAYAYALETGYQFNNLPWQPWVRTGLNVGSGDDDSADGDHETFYQMLPTARLYSFSILYNMMNTEDAFLSLILKPKHNVILRPEFHAISLSEGADRWYLGSGAIHNYAFDDFAARSSNGQDDLGKLLDLTVIWNPTNDVAVMAYYGHFLGDDVVKRFFTTQRRNDLFFLEVTVNF